ncbi:MAG: prepilin peptidase [Anaerolineaceae bacterium]|nr:prepilin peptidase [Anaerolineaceae bacterium]
MNLLNLFWLVPLSVVVSMIINHLADTLPIIRKISFSPFCTDCHKTIGLTRYVLYKACPHCHTKSGKRRILLPFLFIITYVLLFFFPPDYSGIYLSLLIVAFLYLVFIIDLEHRLILHPVSVFGAILFTIIGLYLNGWQNTVLGGGIGFLLMYGLYLFGILFSKWMAKKRGETMDEVALGYGDVNLTAILGLLFGWPRIAVLLFFAILFGGLFSAVYMLILKVQKKYELFTPIPYAPFLIISALILLYISTPK